MYCTCHFRNYLLTGEVFISTSTSSVDISRWRFEIKSPLTSASFVEPAKIAESRVQFISLLLYGMLKESEHNSDVSTKTFKEDELAKMLHTFKFSAIINDPWYPIMYRHVWIDIPVNFYFRNRHGIPLYGQRIVLNRETGCLEVQG